MFRWYHLLIYVYGDVPIIVMKFLYRDSPNLDEVKSQSTEIRPEFYTVNSNSQMFDC